MDPPPSPRQESPHIVSSDVVTQSVSYSDAAIPVVPEGGEGKEEHVPYTQQDDTRVLDKKRERKVKCPVCKVDGHYKKTCPQKGDLEVAATVVTATSSSSLLPSSNEQTRISVAKMLDCTADNCTYVHEHTHFHEHEHEHNHEGRDNTCHYKGSAIDLVVEDEGRMKKYAKRFPSKKSRWTNDYRRRNEGKHTPEEVPNTARRCCIICSKKSHLKCKQCEVFVHATCWEKFHDAETPWNLYI